METIPEKDLSLFMSLPPARREEVLRRIGLLAAIENAPGASWVARARHVSLTHLSVRGASVRSLARMQRAFTREGWRGLASHYRPFSQHSALNS